MKDAEKKEKKSASGKKDDDKLDVQEALLKSRQIILSGEVDKELSESVVSQLFALESKSKKPIYVFIDSPGGDVDAGYAIFDAVRFIEAPVVMVGMGLVASAAALIMLAADKSRRFALPNSHYLIHQPMSEIAGVATDIEIHAKEMDKTKAKINELIAKETGKSLEAVAADTDRDFWMSAEEALEYGLVRKIAASRKDLAI